jgi:uncharacterized protein (DUF934 family)
MTQLIRGKTVVTEPETLNLVTLEEFLKTNDATKTQGVLVDSDEEIEALEGSLDDIPLVALNFPVFSDGRPYSSATILRRRYGYQGEIRAVGDVRLDQLEQMQRCGFNAYELDDVPDLERILESLSGFSHSYQKTVDRDPLYLERPA